MWVVISLVYAVPPVLALILSGFARSRIAAWLLRVTSLICLALLAISTVASFDCVIAEISFTSCKHLPDTFGELMGIVQVLYLLGYFSIGPVVLVVAAVFEWRTRRYI